MNNNPHPLTNYDGHMNTSTGIKFNIFDPTPEMVNITDIARGLAFKAHFGGQSEKFFSIAQHCFLVCDQLPYDWMKFGKYGYTGRDLFLCALLHDASEAYIGDMIKPIKIHFPRFKEIENKIQSVILTKFGVNPDIMLNVKPFDIIAQKIEYGDFYKEQSMISRYLSPEQSEIEFYQRFYEYQNL